MLALVRQPLLDRVDRRLALIIGGSVAVHIAIAAYAWSVDVEDDAIDLPAPPTATAYQDVVDIVIPDPAMVPPTTPATTNALPAVATPVHTPSRSIVRPVHPSTTSGSSPIDPAQLTALFSDDKELRRTPRLEPPTNVEDVHRSDVRSGMLPAETPEQRLGTLHPLPEPEDPTLTHASPTHHDEPTGHIIPGDIKPETSTTLTPALVLERIQSHYMAGLQRCYRLGLAADGTLSGKVAIRFTVEATGAVSDGDANGVSTSVDDCVEQQMTRWRFPAPKDNKGTPRDAAFSVSLALQPS